MTSNYFHHDISLGMGIAKVAYQLNLQL